MNRTRAHTVRIAAATTLAVLAFAVGFGGPASSEPPPLAPSIERPPKASPPEYIEAVDRTFDMVRDPAAHRMVRAAGLDLLNVTWEDTGRYKNSAVGPNISDMTIQVATQARGSRHMQVRCMPVIRKPNFSDVTCDLDPRFFTMLIGNEKGRKLQRVSLYDFLREPTRYLSNPGSWPGRNRTLVAPERDDNVLVSAQACFLPVPKQGLATFNPVLFNYQSYEKNPAVLTILATREGTSATIIDNKRDSFPMGSTWGQRLFHNENGMRASLTGRRESEFKGAQPAQPSGPARETGLNMVLLIQVPLKQREVRRNYSAEGALPAPGADVMAKSRAGDVENAVIGHGELEGPFTEIDNLAIERDPRFPVRVTVQFYKATSNGIVSAADVRSIRDQIERVYAMSDYVGSLVTEGETGRPTEYIGMKVQPPGWWEDFWRRYEANMGESRHDAIRKLRRLLGERYNERPVCFTYLRDVLERK